MYNFFWEAHCTSFAVPPQQKQAKPTTALNTKQQNVSHKHHYHLHLHHHDHHLFHKITFGVSATSNPTTSIQSTIEKRKPLNLMT